MELIYKHMVSEEQEIIDLLLEIDPERTDLLDEKIALAKTVGRAVARIGDTRTCSKISDVSHRYDCMIKVYTKYISSLSADVSRANSDKQKATIKDKIAKAKDRVSKWQQAKKDAGSHQRISRLGSKSKSTGVKTSKKKAADSYKKSKKGALRGFKI